jgi:fructose-1,6-bisphosphatase II
MRCLGGEVLARLVVGSEEQERRCHAMGIGDPRRVYRCRDLAPGKSVLFVATGVTSGGLLEGVRRFEGGARTMSLVMHTEPRRVRFVETIHVQEASEATGLALRF